MKREKKIIIIVPCYNEEDSLPYLVDAIEKMRAKLTRRYQLDLLLINDGSSDKTQELLEILSKEKSFVYYREFARNAGHQSALRAGIAAAGDYDAAIMMDADMQHPPELVPQLLEAWEQGAKIVQMVRRDSSKEAGFFKYLTSRAYYQFINRITNLQLEYGASDFRLIDRSVVQAVTSSKEQDLFLRGYFSWLPVSRVTIPYKSHKRIAGKSKYSVRKMIDLAQKGVLQFSEKPLQLAMSVGIGLALLSFLYGLFLIVRYLLGDYSVSGWTSLMVIMLFCFGINFILMGIIGSYLAQSIRIQKQRPEFIIASEKLPS